MQFAFPLLAYLKVWHLLVNKATFAWLVFRHGLMERHGINLAGQLVSKFMLIRIFYDFCQLISVKRKYTIFIFNI